MVIACTYRPSLVKVDARNFELSDAARPPVLPPATDRTDYNILRRCA